MTNGYPDGQFHPDDTISRAEFVALVNRSFHFNKAAASGFTDVTPDAWYYDDVLFAKQSGYIEGYPDGTFEPGKPVSRGEISAIVARLLSLTTSDSAVRFTDRADIPEWAGGQIGAVLDMGIINGYPNGQFEAGRTASRAEAVVILDRALQVKGGTLAYTSNGTYGPGQGVLTVNGKATVDVPGVTLQHMEIKGDLLLGTGIGDGDADLKSITVSGNTLVQGGGSHSIHVENSHLSNVEVNRADGDVRLAFGGDSSVGTLMIQSGVNIDTLDDRSMVSIDEAVITSGVDEASEVQLNGQVGKLEISAPGVNVRVSGGKVAELHVAPTANGATITLNEGSSIGKATVDGTVTVTGQGSIEQLTVNADGSQFAMQPGRLTVKDGVKTKVNGADKTSADNPPVSPVPSVPTGGTPSTPPSGPSTGGTVPTEQNTVFAHPQTVAALADVMLDRAPVAGVTAWFAPAHTNSFIIGTDKSRLIGDGTTVTMKAPRDAGTYYLYLVNSNGASVASTVALTVVPQAANLADQIFDADLQVAGEAAVTLAAPPESGFTAWFAPAGTSTFVQGQSMSRLVGDGLKRVMNAPAGTGQYKLYLVDANNNVSGASRATLTVDNTAPTSPNQYLKTTKYVSPNATIALDAAPAAGETVWLAPASSITFTEGPTMTELQGDGSLTTMKSPQAEANYRLFVVNSSGAASSPSAASVIVDQTKPNDQNTLLPTSRTVKGGTDISLAQALPQGEIVWLAPAGSMTFAEGTSMTVLKSGQTVKSPTAEGTYKLYVADLAGNVSIPSTASITVDNTAPTGQDALLTTSRATQAGTSLQLTAAIPIGVTAWLAPAGTTAFQAGPSMTALAGNGTTRSIVAPTAEAVYKLFLVDDAGNLSNPSAASVTVDNTAPTDQDALLPTSENTTSGASLTLASSPSAGETVWIAPATATVFAAGSTMTSSTSATISVPTTAAQYKVFVIDTAGNISFPSTATITVQ